MNNYDYNKMPSNNYNYNYNKMPSSGDQGHSLIAKLAVFALAFMYVASPMDVIPDFIPLLGQMDDLSIIFLTVRFIASSGKK